MSQPVSVTPESPAALINRELSWLSFARRVLALAEDPEQPLLERVNFAGIMGMIYDEFAMKRIGGLFRKAQKRQGPRRAEKNLTATEELEACRGRRASLPFHQQPRSQPGRIDQRTGSTEPPFRAHQGAGQPAALGAPAGPGRLGAA
jgi:polyphosphate kinase